MQPYISFVTAVRNDEYADPGYKKLKLNLRILSEQCGEHALEAENILVEWNSEPSRASMREVLRDICCTGALSIRIITVPGSFHSQWRLNELSPMHPSVAINVGVRRARGEFCVLKNQDTFYSRELISFLSKKQLEKGKIYRTVRVDVSPYVMKTPWINKEAFLKLCQESVLEKHSPLAPPKLPFSLPNLFTNACGDFQLMWKGHFFQIRGYPETKDIRAYETDGLLSFSAYGNGIEEVILKAPQEVYKISHGSLNSTRFESPVASSRLLDRFFLALESIWIFAKLAFFLRALFNYPQKFYRGKPIHGYERSLLTFKLLSKFSWITKLKTSKWGYPDQKFEESFLHLAGWENTLKGDKK